MRPSFLAIYMRHPSSTCRQPDNVLMPRLTDRIRQKPTIEATEYANTGGKEDK
jgi:hypothetical protein